jgi:hypothetical protein
MHLWKQITREWIQTQKWKKAESQLKNIIASKQQRIFPKHKYNIVLLIYNIFIYIMYHTIYT